MEKKVITEILRIKELMGGKTLLNEGGGPLPVNIIKFLSRFFKNETDDVVKKIVGASDDNIVTKLKSGAKDLTKAEAELIIKNAGGIDNLYYNTIKETFNEKTYKEFYLNVQNISKNITPELLIKYKTLADKSVDNLFPSNAPQKFKDQFTLFLKNYYDDALKIKNTPEIKPKKTRKPKKETIPQEEPKITTPTPEPNSAIKNLLNDAGEITEAKMLAAIDEDFASLAKTWNIPVDSVNLFKEQVKANIKNAIPADAEKSFENMMKEYERLGPVEKSEFYNDIILKMNERLKSNITLIEKSTFMSKYGIKVAPGFFNWASEFLKSKTGQLFFGTHFNKPGINFSKLIVLAYMIGCEGVLSIVNTYMESMIKTKNSKSYGNKMYNEFINLFNKKEENEDILHNRWADFLWDHCFPFASIIVSCFKIVWHFGEAAVSNTSSWRKDMSDDSDDDSDKKNGKEKLMEKGLEVFKEALEKEGVAQDVLDAITIKGSGFIYTNGGEDYVIHNELKGKNAYVTMPGTDGNNYNYNFTNDQFK